MTTNNSESFAIATMDATFRSNRDLNLRIRIDQLRSKVPASLPGRLENASSETIKNAMLIRAGIFVMAHGVLLAAVIAANTIVS